MRNMVILILGVFLFFNGLIGSEDSSSGIQKTRYYPIRNAEFRQLIGLFEFPYADHLGDAVEDKDPFKPRKGVGARLPQSSEVLFTQCLEELGLRISSEDVSRIFYDGEQLIVLADDQSHRRLSTILSELGRPNQVRCSFWIERELQASGQSVPTHYKAPIYGMTTKSGKRGSLGSKEGPFNINLTPSINEDRSIAALVELSFRAIEGFPVIEITTQFESLAGAEVELASIRFQSAPIDSNSNNASQIEHYRVMAKLETIASNGKERPLDDSLLERLGLPDSHQYETAIFPVSRAQMIRLVGWRGTKMSRDLWAECFEENGIQFNDSPATNFCFVEKRSNRSPGKALAVRHTPATLERIRALLEASSRVLGTRAQTTLTYECSTTSERRSVDLRIRSLSGKRAFLKFAEPDREAPQIQWATTTNIDLYNACSALEELSVKGVEQLPSVDIARESCSKDGLVRKQFELEREGKGAVTVSSSSSRLDRYGRNQAHEPVEEFMLTKLLTDFYPINARNVIRFIGYEDTGMGSDGATDPFKSSGDPQTEQIGKKSPFVRFFEQAGLDFSLDSGAGIEFDGEQLIITQTPEGHEQIREIFRQSNSVDFGSQINSEIYDAEMQKIGRFCFLAESGRRQSYELQFPKGGAFKLSATVSRESLNEVDCSFELMTDAALFPKLLPVSLTSEFTANEAAAIEIARIPTIDGQDAQIVTQVK